MDGFLSKIDNLAYELFGIVLPGLVASVFLTLLWIALGPMVPIWTRGHIPSLESARVLHLIDRIGALQIAAVIGTLMVWYFLGHSINWISKGRSRKEGEFKARMARILSFLKFRINKPTDFFDPDLKNLFEQVCRQFSANTLTWREFYPLAKNYIMNSGRNSLLSTYQNKYTLHRSIAAAAAGLFWLSISSSVLAGITRYLGVAASPNWFLLGALIVASFLIVMGFSATFAFYWTLWGDTVVTETYCALLGRVGNLDGSHEQPHSN